MTDFSKPKIVESDDGNLHFVPSGEPPVRPIMKILNQVRELIIDAHNAGEQKGRKQVAEFANHFAGIKHNPEWQAQLKKWGIE